MDHVTSTTLLARLRPVHMRDSSAPIRRAAHCGDVALQRMPIITMTAKTTIGEDDPRPDPPLVYPDAGRTGWIVQPPEHSEALDSRRFAGPNAETAALEFAYRNYGCARY